MKTLNVCPSLLSEGYHTYSPLALRRLFNGKQVSHLLSFSLKAKEKNSYKPLYSLSISGYQRKFLMTLENTTLRITQKGEQSTYILKPISEMPKNEAFAPANEHLTMQIAQQVFGIETAEHALIFFADGTPAYITKRFDIAHNGEKYAVEDFASLLGKTVQTHGTDYKYTGTYLDLFNILKKNVAAWQVESLKLFTLIAFNYLFSNGDAHLKNFSLIQSPQGDFRLSPAYDLLNTAIHIDDHPFALKSGLLPSPFNQQKIREQFLLLGKEVGLPEKLITKTLTLLTSHTDKVITLIQRSFLPEKLQRNYLQTYQRKIKRLAISD